MPALFSSVYIRFSRAHIAGIRGFATAFSCQGRAANGVESSVKLPTAPNTKSPISKTWFRRFRRKMMRRKIHGLLGLRDRPPNYMRQFRMRFGSY
jgi:hypothetical protein